MGDVSVGPSVGDKGEGGKSVAVGVGIGGAGTEGGVGCAGSQEHKEGESSGGIRIRCHVSIYKNIYIDNCLPLSLHIYIFMAIYIYSIYIYI